MLSSCFIRDLALTVDEACRGSDAQPYAVYTPAGTEPALRALLPASFRLLLQCEGEFGTRLLRSVQDLLALGHSGAILINADSPTLPVSIIEAAIAAVHAGDTVVLSPALDGGYTLIGVSQPHARLFEDIAWSTPAVHGQTVERAAEIGLPVVTVPGWYDVDEAISLRLLEAEIAGEQLPRSMLPMRGASAPATRRFLEMRRMPVREVA